MTCRIALIVLVVGSLTYSIRGAEPAESPFNVHDPEIQALKKLNWRTVDFNALEPRERCQALLAMTALLDLVGGKADARSELLAIYIDQNKLGEDYAANEAQFANKPMLTYEDACKVAAAFLKTSKGQSKFGDDLQDAPDSVLKNYQTLYDKTCRRKWDEVVESRTYVQSMAQFLQKAGKWDDYLKWSAAEAAKRQTQYEEDRKAKQAAYVKAQAEKHEQALNAAQQAAEARKQAELQRMSYAMQTQSGGGEEAASDDTWNDWDSGSSDWGWGGDSYYVNQIWRYNARDEVRNKVTHWQGGGGRGRVGGGRR
jgi:hypothetical protein